MAGASGQTVCGYARLENCIQCWRTPLSQAIMLLLLCAPILSVLDYQRRETALLSLWPQLYHGRNQIRNNPLPEPTSVRWFVREANTVVQPSLMLSE